MAGEWMLSTLCDAGVTLIDCEHRTPPAASAGLPYIAIPQIKAGRLELSDARRISPEHFNEWTRKANPQTHDVILSRRCNPGETGFVPDGLRCALGQNLVLLRADGSRVYPPFLRWLARGGEWWGQIGKFLNVGAVFDSLKCADILKFRLLIPPVEDQKNIASMLGSLDDKIELNRRMNETLEAIARAIFKSWFVDFDPVRAKTGGRQPAGLSIEIAALFPESFSDSPLGKIPLGWEVQPIGDVTRVVGGSTPRTDEPAYWENGTHAWATPKDMASLASPFLLDTDRHITEEGLAQISSGLLPKGTVLLSSRAPIGYLALAELPVAVNQGFIALVCEQKLPNLFVLNWVRANLEEIKAHANGTTFLEISKGNFRPLRAVVPPRSILDSFVTLTRPIYERISANLHESMTLTQIRDSLLPKLMSGAIRLKDAEKIVEIHA